jgi:hypothetical protein
MLPSYFEQLLLMSKKKKTAGKIYGRNFVRLLQNCPKNATHMVKRAVFSKSSKILNLLFFQLLFMSPKVKITKKRKTFTAAKFSAGLAEKFCQELAFANCEDKMNSSAKNIH